MTVAAVTCVAMTPARPASRRTTGGAIAMVLRAAIVAGTVAGSAGTRGGAARAAEEPAAGEMTDAAATAAARAAADRGVAWLIAAQQPDGSWGSGTFRGSAAVTAQVTMALVAAGSTPASGRHAAALRAGVERLLACARPDGLVAGNEQAAHGPMYAHVFAMMALAEVYGETRDDDRVARTLAAARDLLVRTQDASGGWRYKPAPGDADVSVTAAAVVALRGLVNAGFEVDAATVERAAAYVAALQNADGGFRYQAAEGPGGAARTAAAVFALLVAERDADAVDRGCRWLDAHPLRLGGADGYALYGLSYEAAVRWRRRRAAVDPGWDAWYARTARLLLAAQRADGAWQDPSCPEYGTAAAVAVLSVPLGTTPLFEVERAEDDPPGQTPDRGPRRPGTADRSNSTDGAEGRR